MVIRFAPTFCSWDGPLPNPPSPGTRYLCCNSGQAPGICCAPVSTGSWTDRTHSTSIQKYSDTIPEKQKFKFKGNFIQILLKWNLFSILCCISIYCILIMCTIVFPLCFDVLYWNECIILFLYCVWCVLLIYIIAFLCILHYIVY